MRSCRSAGQHRRQLGRVPDRRRAADDDRPAAVVGADPEQPPQDVGDVAPEHAAVRVQLVDDDEPELLEQLEPLRVMGEDRRVEHVRVGDDDLAGGPDRRADRCRRVAVVGRGRDVQPGRRRQLAELGDLVLAERLGREQEEGPGRRVLGDRLEDGHGVAQGLARRGRGHDHDVLAGVDGLDRLRLVGVRPLDAATRARPATIRGSSQSGKSAWIASRGGRTAWWTTPRASDGSASSSARTAPGSAGA